jgi:hypothetical protein
MVHATVPLAQTQTGDPVAGQIIGLGDRRIHVPWCVASCQQHTAIGEKCGGRYGSGNCQ